MEIQKPLPPFIEPTRREEAKTFVSNQPRFQGSLLPVGKENLGTRLVSNLAYTRRGLQNKSENTIISLCVELVFKKLESR